MVGGKKVFKVDRGNPAPIPIETSDELITMLREQLEGGGGPAELGTLELSITPAVALDRDNARRFEDLGVDRLIPLSMERSGDGLVEFVEKLGNDLGA